MRTLLLSFADDYPLAPLEVNRQLVNADVRETKQLGIRCVLGELVQNLYIWMIIKVCGFSHVYVSVPTLRQEGHFTDFGKGLRS